MKISGLIEKTLTDYPGHTACTVFTDGCNFRCPYCRQQRLQEGNAEAVISEADFFRFLDRAAELKAIDSVVITGGEPTVNADLPDFIRHIKGYYGFRVKLCTNASNIVMLDEFLCEGMIDYIAMDIKAGRSGYSRIAGREISDEIFHSIQGCLDLFEGKFEGLPLFPYEFRTTVVGGLHTDEDFRELGELLHGIRRYVLQFYKPPADCSIRTKAADTQAEANASESSAADAGLTEAAGCRAAGPDTGCCSNILNSFHTPTREEMLHFKSIVAPHVGEVVIRHLDMN